MFDLIESCPERREGLGWTGRIVSALIHIFLLSAAIAATRGVLHATGGEGITASIVRWSSPPPRSGSPGSVAHCCAPQPVIPVTVPTTIPDPGLVATNLPGDPAPSIPGFGADSGFAPHAILGTPDSLLMDSRLVDQQPELVSHPALRYPDVLRRAGIEGRVMVEVVLDTLGRAEPGSARIKSSAHQLFDPEAVAVVSGSVYRPARVSGRAVRVRVHVPVSFTLRT